VKWCVRACLSEFLCKNYNIHRLQGVSASPIIKQGVSASPIIKQGVSASPIIIKQGVSASPIIKQGVSASPIVSMCNLCLTSAIFVSYPCVPHIQLATYPHCIVSKGIIMVNVWLKRGRISFSSLQSAAHNCVSILIAICSP
jgi:hypothetical protein